MYMYTIMNRCMYETLHAMIPDATIIEFMMIELPPENDDAGNIEYKRYLESNITSRKLNQRATQLKWRAMQSDAWNAIYYIGVDDDGSFYRLTESQAIESLIVLAKMAALVKGHIERIEWSIDATLFLFRTTIQLPITQLEYNI